MQSPSKCAYQPDNYNCQADMHNFTITFNTDCFPEPQKMKQ